MCPACWAALIAQVLFVVSLGLLLVVITDLWIGLPVAVGTLLAAIGNFWWSWDVPHWVLGLAVAGLLVRAICVLRAQPEHFVRRTGIRLGNWAASSVRSVRSRFKAKGVVPTNDSTSL